MSSIHVMPSNFTTSIRFFFQPKSQPSNLERMGFQQDPTGSVKPTPVCVGLIDLAGSLAGIQREILPDPFLFLFIWINFFLLHSTFWLRAASYMLKNPELLEKFATIAMASVGSGKDEEAISWTSGTKIPLSFYNYVYIYI